jgi:hypothetical protein
MYMLAMHVAPPMYHDDEGRWSEVWRERLDVAEPLIRPWLDHPERDAFWQSKSIPLESIDVPTFVIGGWRDLYPDAMPRTYERIDAPRKLWMGPWPHVAPDSAPVEAVEYLPEIRRWLDRFVCDEQNGIDTEPPVTLFVQGEGGRWTHEREWPVARTHMRTLGTDGDRRLVEDPPPENGSVSYVCEPTVGMQAGLWDVRGTGLGLPLDQRVDDERSLAFTSRSLAEPLEITGRPEARLSLTIEDGKDAHLVVKLCDVADDGASTLITTGWLKLRPTSHALGDESNYRRLDVRVPLWATSYRIPAGNRVRMSVSCADFPRIWPSRTNARLKLFTGVASSISLPVVRPATIQGPWPGPSDPSTKRSALLHEASPTWRHALDPAARSASVEFVDRRVLTSPGGDGRLGLELHVRAAVEAETPASAFTEGSTRLEMTMPSGEEAVVVVSSRITHDEFTASACVQIDGEPRFERQWSR